jgi:hypothetical protein
MTKFQYVLKPLLVGKRKHLCNHSKQLYVALIVLGNLKWCGINPYTDYYDGPSRVEVFSLRHFTHYI